MTITEVLPLINNVFGGVLMAIAIWALVTGKVVFPREVSVFKLLYDRECERSKRLEDLNETMVQELANQNAGHLSSIELLKQLVQPLASERKQGYTSSNNPGRRSDDR